MNSHRVLRIGIASYEQTKRRTIDIAAGRLKPGPEDPRIWLTSLSEVSRIFSKNTMLLLEIIKNSEPDSVADLAKIAKRKTSNVSRTLQRLQEFGLVELKEGPGRRRAPRVTFEDYLVEGSLRNMGGQVRAA